MPVQKPTQRRFSVLGTNTFTIANKLIQNQRLCRLLKYQVRDPFDADKYEDIDGLDLLNKQILIVPKIWDESTEKKSYIVALFSSYNINFVNPDYKIATIRFDVACPYDEWILNDQSLRPYLIMQEIDDTFNGARLAGIGTLKFLRSEAIVLTSQIGGYSMLYQIDEFN